MSISIQGKMMRGAVWMLLLKLVDHSPGFISTLDLVHLLSPTDFEIVGMGLSFGFMAELLTAFGFDIALVQHPNPTEEHYRSAWTCNVLLLCAIITILLPGVVFLVLCALASGLLLASLAVGLLWVMAGRIDSAERHVLERIRTAVSTLFSSH